MTSRTRLWVLLVSTPIIAFAFVGGYLGQAWPRTTPIQHLRVFEDVVSLVVNNYVEEVDVKKAMQGAMQRAGRRPRSRQRLPDARSGAGAWNPTTPAARRKSASMSTRQYYLRVVVRPRRLARGEGRPPARRLHPRASTTADARHVGVRGRAAAARRARHRRSSCWSFAATPPIRTRSMLTRERADRRRTSRRGWRTRRPATSACSSSPRPRRRSCKQAVDALAKTGRHALRHRPARHGRAAISTTASRPRGCS